VKKALFLIFAASFCGCSTLLPYKSPSKDASLMERHEIYAEHCVTYDYDWWNGARIRVGGEASGGWWNMYSRFKNYYDSSGDTQSGEMVGEFSPWNWTALGVGLSGLVVGEVLANQNLNNWQIPLFTSVAVGLGGEIGIVEWGHWHHFRPAANSFDEYLRRDLGIFEYSQKSFAKDTTNTVETNYSGDYLLKAGGNFDKKYRIIGFTLNDGIPAETTPTATIEVYDRRNDVNIHLACDAIIQTNTHLTLKVSDMESMGPEAMELEGNFVGNRVIPATKDDFENKEKYDFVGIVKFQRIDRRNGKGMKNLKFVCVE
jgi:hypothetical protein